MFSKSGSFFNTLLILEFSFFTLSSDLYKIRLENSSSKVGKSGGFRVIYYYIDENANLYLLKIYSKTEISNIKEEVLIKILNEQMS